MKDAKSKYQESHKNPKSIKAPTLNRMQSVKRSEKQKELDA